MLLEVFDASMDASMDTLNASNDALISATACALASAAACNFKIFTDVRGGWEIADVMLGGEEAHRLMLGVDEASALGCLQPNITQGSGRMAPGPRGAGAGFGQGGSGEGLTGAGALHCKCGLSTPWFIFKPDC